MPRTGPCAYPSSGTWSGWNLAANRDPAITKTVGASVDGQDGPARLRASPLVL
ncbi:hypothetical protein ACFVTP_26450 [Streptomyces celluloflavus]|uniref:hypothetical protein n=1 Tax=Streptomyces celluloflavus TaxID=58344 RepID=UPI0036D7C072